jgi:Cu+-exporting ATPase
MRNWPRRPACRAAASIRWRVPWSLRRASGPGVSQAPTVRAVAGRGTEGEVGGRSFLIASLRWLRGTGRVRWHPLQAEVQRLQGEGATVSALVERAEGLALRALMAFADEPKPGAAEAFAALRRAGCGW